MKKTIKYVLLFIFMLIPINVFAISYTLGTPMKGTDAQTFIDISVTDVSSFAVNKSDPIQCKTSNEESLECNIQPKDKDYTKEGNIIVKNSDFAEKDVIARITIKNKTTKDITTTVKFIVNGESEPYKIIENVSVSRNKSGDSSITKLTINNGKLDPSFQSDVFDYVIYDYSDTYPNITMKYECEYCVIEAEGGSTNKVDKDNNEVKFTTKTSGVTEYNLKLIVKSEDGTGKSTYNIKLYKGESAYNSKYLKSLSVDGFELSPKFDKETKEYTITVPKKVESIESLLKYATEDDQAKVKVEGAGTLDKDENEVKITVTNRSNETLEYTLKVIREDQTESVIEVIGYKDDKVSYMDTEGVRQELAKNEFKDKYPDEWKKIEDGTYQFDENGNIIKEKNEENSNKNSNSTVKKENKFPWIIVVLIVVSLIIIGVAGFIIFRDPDKKKKKGEPTIEPIEGTPEEPIADKVDTPIVPVEEQEAELNRMDTYDEEARLEAENSPVITPEEVQETIVQEETIDDYVDDDKTPTTDIDEALSDLMNTKEYNFKDKE